MKYRKILIYLKIFYLFPQKKAFIHWSTFSLLAFFVSIASFCTKPLVRGLTWKYPTILNREPVAQFWCSTANKQTLHAWTHSTSNVILFRWIAYYMTIASLCRVLGVKYCITPNTIKIWHFLAFHIVKFTIKREGISDHGQLMVVPEEVKWKGSTDKLCIKRSTLKGSKTQLSLVGHIFVNIKWLDAFQKNFISEVQYFKHMALRIKELAEVIQWLYP